MKKIILKHFINEDSKFPCKNSKIKQLLQLKIKNSCSELVHELKTFLILFVLLFIQLF